MPPLRLGVGSLSSRAGRIILLPPLVKKVSAGVILGIIIMAATGGGGAGQIRTCHSLEFDSWWTEGTVKRYVYIKYNIVDGTFQISIDEDNNLYHIPVVYNHKTGDTVTVWDLCVGGEIDILGRITTLQHCSQMTAQWNTYWAERLQPLHERLEKELRKYENCKREPWLSFARKDVPVGGRNLRMLISQIHELQGRLAEYRPRLAEKLGVPVEMYEIESMHLEKETT